MAPADGARTLSPRRYDRRAELSRLLPLDSEELDDETPQARERLLAKLRRALRAERRRGIAGHWTYDLARHAELLRVYRLELACAGPGSPDPAWHPAPKAPDAKCDPD